MGFDPVLEADEDDPAGQVLGILADPGRWQAHVDRARTRLAEVGDWRHRVTALRTALPEGE